MKNKYNPSKWHKKKTQSICIGKVKAKFTTVQPVVTKSACYPDKCTYKSHHFMLSESTVWLASVIYLDLYRQLFCSREELLIPTFLYSSKWPLRSRAPQDQTHSAKEGAATAATNRCRDKTQGSNQNLPIVTKTFPIKVFSYLIIAQTESWHRCGNLFHA